MISDDPFLALQLRNLVIRIPSIIGGGLCLFAQPEYGGLAVFILELGECIRIRSGETGSVTIG
jgi:hypothetical protein